MGNDNIMKEIEKIKQEINKEVRGKGKWIGDKYVYTPLHKETLFLKVIFWVIIVGVFIITPVFIWLYGGFVFCVSGHFLGFDMDWFCESEGIGFYYKPIQIVMDFFGW